MQVTYHTIARDEYKGGNHAICARCDAKLKNYAKIGAEIYGLDCAASVMNKSESQIKRSWEHHIRMNRKPMSLAQASKMVQGKQ